jgi:chromosomal replication initiator protein
MYLSRKYTDTPLQAIGQSYNRYHATVLHAINTVEIEIKGNTAFKQQVEHLAKILEQEKL